MYARSFFFYKLKFFIKKKQLNQSTSYAQVKACTRGLCRGLLTIQAE